MALPCSCELPEIKGKIENNKIYICERCARVILSLKLNKMKDT